MVPGCGGQLALRDSSLRAGARGRGLSRHRCDVLRPRRPTRIRPQSGPRRQGRLAGLRSGWRGPGNNREERPADCAAQAAGLAAGGRGPQAGRGWLRASGPWQDRPAHRPQPGGLRWLQAVDHRSGADLRHLSFVGHQHAARLLRPGFGSGQFEQHLRALDGSVIRIDDGAEANHSRGTELHGNILHDEWQLRSIPHRVASRRKRPGLCRRNCHRRFSNHSQRISSDVSESQLRRKL